MCLCVCVCVCVCKTTYIGPTDVLYLWRVVKMSYALSCHSHHCLMLPARQSEERSPREIAKIDHNYIIIISMLLDYAKRYTKIDSPSKMAAAALPCPRLYWPLTTGDLDLLTIIVVIFGCSGGIFISGELSGCCVWSRDHIAVRLAGRRWIAHAPCVCVCVCVRVCEGWLVRL